VTYFNTTTWASVVADDVPRLPRVESTVTQTITIQLTIFLQFLHSLLTKCHLSVLIIPIEFEEIGDFSSAIEVVTYLKIL
jgi:hypothetical protein